MVCNLTREELQAKINEFNNPECRDAITTYPKAFSDFHTKIDINIKELKDKCIIDGETPDFIKAIDDELKTLHDQLERVNTIFSGMNISEMALELSTERVWKEIVGDIPDE